MHVFSALLYLRVTSLRNLVLGRLRRLRQPKYLIGGIAGAFYFWAFFFRRRGPGNPGQVFTALFGEGRAEWITAGVLTLFALVIWMTPNDQPGLAFSEAEVAFLFPAPLSRRQLIHYKLISALLMSLFGAVFFTLVSGGLRTSLAEALRLLLFWWMFNTVLSFHQTGAALTISRLAAAGLHARRRRLLIIACFILFVALVTAAGIRFGPDSVAWLLWPARVIVRPLRAVTPGAFGLAMLPAVGLVALHYFWVHRMETPFEEASIVRAQKQGETVARLRAGRSVAFGRIATARRAPFALVDRLPPEFALLWKNLMAAPSYLNRKVFLTACALISFGLTWLQHRPDLDGRTVASVAGFAGMGILGYLMIIGPQLARNDLRGDLNNIDLFKTYPLPGWRIVLGSLLAPTVILTGIAWLCVLTAVVGLNPSSNALSWLSPELKIVSGLALAIIVPPLCAVQLLVPNAATLIFPAWAQNTRGPGTGGMDVMGQRLIFFAGQVICLAVALLPAVGLAAFTIAFTPWLIGLPAAIILATIGVESILVGEIWLGVRLLGPQFERLDLSAEMRP